MNLKLKPKDRGSDSITARNLNRLKSAIIELACAIDKGNPNISQRTHLQCFWDLIEDCEQDIKT